MSNIQIANFVYWLLEHHDIRGLRPMKTRDGFHIRDLDNQLEVPEFYTKVEELRQEFFKKYPRGILIGFGSPEHRRIAEGIDMHDSESDWNLLNAMHELDDHNDDKDEHVQQCSRCDDMYYDWEKHYCQSEESEGAYLERIANEELEAMLESKKKDDERKAAYRKSMFGRFESILKEKRMLQGNRNKRKRIEWIEKNLDKLGL